MTPGRYLNGVRVAALPPPSIVLVEAPPTDGFAEIDAHNASQGPCAGSVFSDETGDENVFNSPDLSEIAGAEMVKCGNLATVENPVDNS